MGVGSNRSQVTPFPPSPPTPSPLSASEAEVVERGVSPVANLPPNAASLFSMPPNAALLFRILVDESSPGLREFTSDTSDAVDCFWA